MIGAPFKPAKISPSLGEPVGLGLAVGDAVGEAVGLAVGEAVGLTVGEAVGLEVGEAVGEDVGELVGELVGDGDGFGPPPPKLPITRIVEPFLTSTRSPSSVTGTI